MIARIRAFLGARRQLREEVDYQLSRVAEQDAVIGRLSGMLSAEQMTVAGLTTEAREATKRTAALLLRAETAEGEAARLRADHTYVTAERCECGGDAELHWRTRAVAAEKQAAQDRANAQRMTEQVAYWRQRVDTAEHHAHIAEQLGRAR